MNKLTEKIRTANYPKLLARWLILALCVGLLGAVSSFLLLRPQLREAAAALQSREQEKTLQMDAQGEKRHAEHDWEDLSISEPSPAAKAAVGGTAAAALLFFGVYWLLVAGWIYQKSLQAGMNAMVWGFLGLLGNLGAGMVFLLVRSVLRRKCAACGTWQQKALYCRACGEKQERRCPSCGETCTPEDHFCHHCGKALEE